MFFSFRFLCDGFRCSRFFAKQIRIDEEANEEEGEGGVNGEANAHILNGLLAHRGTGGEQLQTCDVQGNKHADKHLSRLQSGHSH